MSAFTRFLIRAHRRRIAWRLIEHAAIGVLVGCAVAAVLLLVAWWRQVDAIAPVLAVLFVSSIAGIVASIWRRPTLIDTARLIETQLDSPELLSSAMLSTNHPDRSFVDALHALADARVAGVTPASLVLLRFGSRAWSGVGLAAASVIIVALMISAPINSREAIAKAPDSIDAWLTDRADSSKPQSTQNASHVDEPSQRDPTPSRSIVDAGAEASSKSSNSVARSREGVSGASANSRGAGSAHTDSQDSNLIARNSTSPPISSGTLAAGGSGAATNSGTLGLASAGSVSASTPQQIAPWNSEHWSRDRDAALDAVRSGAIPDAYRSLVQDYFQRP